MSKSTNQSTEVIPTFGTVEQYVAADRKGRAEVRSLIEGMIEVNRDALADHLKAGDLAKALESQNVVTDLQDTLAAFKSAAGTPTKAEVNWTALVANRLATIEYLNDHAFDLTIGLVPEAHRAEVEAAWTDGNLNDGEADVAMADKFASVALVRLTKVNDVPTLIRNAFIGQPVNTRLSVAQVVNHAAANGSTVSNGAVTAQCAKGDGFDKVPGIIAVASNATQPRGFVNKVEITDPDTGDEG